ELVRRNDTRWWGNHGMADRMLRLEAAIRRYFLHAGSASTRQLTVEEWEQVRQMLGVL
ncbi:unnamed protein product, partial [Phaeothamnion confervicola]